MTALDGRLVDLLRGRGGCACLVGESGVGKTRLAAEIAARAAELAIHVIGGECEQHAPALHPLRAVLREAAERGRTGGRAGSSGCSGRPPACSPRTSPRWRACWHRSTRPRCRRRRSATA